jgi:uncharacterized protein (TIGR02453 family)
MSDATVFSGFTRETVRFYAGLRKNNNKPWFEEHRGIFEGHAMAEAKLFVTAMGERLKKIAPGLVAIPAVNKSIFRIYRDTRFSLDPTPYKTHLGIYFWDGTRPKMESAGFYFQLEPPDVYLGGGMYMIPDNLLDGYRRAVVDRTRGPELGKIVAALRARPGFTVEGEHYKRVPAGFDPGHPNAGLLKHKGLYTGFETKLPAELYSARLVDYCLERFEPVVPLNRWLMKLYG